ncbi:unnamed protein product [Ceratitis capitata]|uniref:(Mediterranean fruit fly) hypothetical protein n=1 Tax=Ceratitis capitata TaxID=7213 RepID=A0A811UHJ4_CERCA|nr:unnamed protein product [Ceratitis capitata]
MALHVPHNSCTNNNSCTAAVTNNKPLTPTKTTVRLFGSNSNSDCANHSPNGSIGNVNCSNTNKNYNNLSNNVEQLVNTALKALHLPQCVGGGGVVAGGGGSKKATTNKLKLNAVLDGVDVEGDLEDNNELTATNDDGEVQMRCACPENDKNKNNKKSNATNNINSNNRSMTVTTTFRSSSTSALMTAGHMRPQTLNVHHLRETPTDQTQIFIRCLIRATHTKLIDAT